MRGNEDLDEILAARLAVRPMAVRPPDEVIAIARSRAQRRRVVRRGAAGVAAVAAVAVAVVGGRAWLQGPEMRTRGGSPPPPVRIEAIAEGPVGARPVGDGARLGAEEALVVRVIAGGEGLLSVEADGGSAVARGRDRRAGGQPLDRRGSAPRLDA